ncbi:MAG: hypothetical protein KA239_00570 [Bacteroidia bacterium]|nr:hypothetical protein [Bacteroidia bacterium]
MNKNFFAGLFAGLCLLAIFAFKPAAEKPVVAVQKWEYLTFRSSFGKVLDAKLMEVGLQGWELAGTLEGIAYIFKRPVQ